MNSGKQDDTIDLHISDPSNYYPGDKRSLLESDSTSIVKKIKQDLLSWDSSTLKSMNLSSVLDSETPRNLAKLISTQSSQNISLDVTGLITFYSGVNELLRHSWALFNLNLDDSAKLVGISKALEQICQQNQRLAHYKQVCYLLN